jgi:DNA-binding response OmpR family regulator
LGSSEIVHPKIAYVETEPDLREIMLNLLQKHGFVVAGYDSSESFLSEFKAGLYDLIISGTHLPKMKGSVELYRNLKRIDPKQRYLFVSV